MPVYRLSRAHRIQGLVIADSKGDRRDLLDAYLFGVKRVEKCVEDLTSGSDPIRGACGSAATGGEATDSSTGGSAESIGGSVSAGSPSPLSPTPGTNNIGV